MKKPALLVLAIMLVPAIPAFADPVVGINGSGAVKFGNASALTCDATTEGSLRYDAGGDLWQYCDSVTWRDLASGAGGLFEDVSGTGAGPIRATSGVVDYATADFVFGSPSLDDDGSAGTDDDVRMFFDKSKAAFRAGMGADPSWYSDGGYAVWDNANTGNFSVAFGYYTKASGDFSAAMGEATVASGIASTAMGFDTTASGAYSTALGQGTVASAGWNFVTGWYSTASGTGSTAIGAEVDSAGAYSVAIGLQSSNSQLTDPKITGDRTMGLFFDGGVANANSGYDITANDLFAIIGGRALIDPTRTKADTATGGEQDLELHVQGDIGAINYCDEAGNNCFTAADAGGTPAGNSGEIQFNSGGSFGASSNLFWDNTDGRLGIGTSPTYLLDIYGAGNQSYRIKTPNDSEALVRFENSSRAWRLGVVPGGDFQIYDSTAATERLRIDNAGNLGIKQASPVAPLDVGGEIRVGTSTGLICNASHEGTMRYNSASKCVELCDAVSWACLNADTACDTTPASFDFADQTGLTADTLVSSNILQITGVDSGCMISVGISGDGSPEYRVCDDSLCGTETQTWTNQNLSFDIQGKYVQLRATTDSAPSTTRTVTANIGNGSNDWQITTTSTGPCGDVGPGDEGTVCSDGSVYAGVSPDGNRNMYVARCDIGMSWDGSNCNGSRSQLPWNNGNASNFTLTGAQSTTTGAFNSSDLANLDSDSGTAGDQPHQAAQACDDLTDHGQTDWYLPAKDELNVIYQKLMGVISGFASAGYWSSSEYNTNHACHQDFDGGSQMCTDLSWNKNGTYAVRCARKD